MSGPVFNARIEPVLVTGLIAAIARRAREFCSDEAREARKERGEVMLVRGLDRAGLRFFDALAKLKI